MSTTLNLKRKNIDLPIEAWQKLSMMAVAQGKSLKKYIESLLLTKANSISIDVQENASPSGDAWFDNPENIASVNRGIAEMKAGEGQALTLDEISKMLGV